MSQDTNPHNIVNSSEKYSHFLTDEQRQSLQEKLQQDLSPVFQQRIQIMLLIDQGYSIAEICQELGCAKVTAEYWASVAQKGFVEQWQSQPVGRPRKMDDRYIQRLQELIQQDPRNYGYPFQRWTIDWLIKHLAQELGVQISNRNLKRVLKDLGLSTCKKLPSQQKDQVRVTIQDLAPTPQLPPSSYESPFPHHNSFSRATHSCLW